MLGFRIAEIARNAIKEIDNIAQLVSTAETTTSTAAINRQTPSSSRNALSELRQRFPSSGPGPAPRARYGRRGNAIVGWPSKGYAIKDIVIVGAGVDKTPLGRTDKLRLEEKNRVISGFAISKTWNEKTLYEKVKAQFPEDCKCLDFEFVKNCCGTLVTPRLASGVKIDANILLRSIASTGAVYVRLYVEDFDENDDESQFDMSPFEELQGVGLRTELGSDNLHSTNSVVDEGTLQPTGKWYNTASNH